MQNVDTTGQVMVSNLAIFFYVAEVSGRTDEFFELLQRVFLLMEDHKQISGVACGSQWRTGGLLRWCVSFSRPR